MELRVDNMLVSLTKSEYLICEFLARNRGQVFSKEQIYRAVWKQEPINCENTIMCCISQLRKKIESNPRKPTYIRTVRGIGYKFVAPED